MEIALLIAAVILGSITYSITTRNTIGTQRAYVKRWFVCVVVWWLVIAVVLGIA